MITDAPWWAWLALIYLVFIGIQAMRTRVISVKRVVVLPLLFIVWSFYNLYNHILLGYVSLLPLWLICLAIGAYLGVKEVQKWKIHVDRHKGELTIPGNYSTLALIVLIFAVKFFWGAYYATHTTISYSIYFWDTLSSALITGFFVGRAGSFLNRYRKKS